MEAGKGMKENLGLMQPGHDIRPKTADEEKGTKDSQALPAQACARAP